MSGLTRPAHDGELARLWPAVEAAHVLAGEDEFRAIAAAQAWRVRVSVDGDAVLLAPWRATGDALAIRALWATDARIPALIDEMRHVAEKHGFTSLLSPLAPAGALAPYREAGMAPRQELVVFWAPPFGVRQASPPPGTLLRPGGAADVGPLSELDAECFDEFWRYGPAEVTHAIERERVMLCEAADGGLLGYASCSRFGATVTLGRLAVSPQARRQGVARALVADVARWAGEIDAHGISLCTQADNEGSRALYRASFFTERRERYALMSVSTRR